MDKIVLLEGNAPEIYKEYRYMNASLLIILLKQFFSCKKLTLYIMSNLLLIALTAPRVSLIKYQIKVEM